MRFDLALCVLFVLLRSMLHLVLKHEVVAKKRTGGDVIPYECSGGAEAVQSFAPPRVGMQFAVMQLFKLELRVPAC